MNFWQYIATNYTEILALLLEHIKLTAISVGLAVLIGVPLGIFISYMSKASKIVLSIANVIQAIPSMALLGFMIPFLGIGAIPAVTAVVLYSLLPIIKNTYTGLESIKSSNAGSCQRNRLNPIPNFNQSTNTAGTAGYYDRCSCCFCNRSWFDDNGCIHWRRRTG